MELGLYKLSMIQVLYKILGLPRHDTTWRGLSKNCRFVSEKNRVLRIANTCIRSNMTARLDK